MRRLPVGLLQPLRQFDTNMPLDNSVLPTQLTPALNWNGVCSPTAIHQINETHAVELED